MTNIVVDPFRDPSYAGTRARARHVSQTMLSLVAHDHKSTVAKPLSVLRKALKNLIVYHISNT